MRKRRRRERMALVVRPNLRLHPTPKLQRPPVRAFSSHQLHGAEGRKLLATKSTRRRGRIPVIYCLLPGASLREEGTPESSSKPKMILWSDVVVKKPGRRVYWGRKWSSSELITAGVILSMHLLCLFAPFTFNWGALWTAVLLYVITGLLGITLSFHRNLAHRSFTLPKWLEYSFAYCGALALQGNPLDWVSTHRYHHQYCDSAQDPHSPTEGFWYSHMSWLFDTASLIDRCGGISNVGDLEKQPFYRFLQRTYMAHPVALALLLYAAGGLPFLVWAMAVRTVWVYHITWLVNSACHVWGRRAWNTGDLSKNNWWVAVLAFGEGWHNNHHAFEYSARHGLEWWEVDMTWYVVRLLQALGLAVDVKLPSERQKQRMSLAGAVAGGCGCGCGGGGGGPAFE